MPSDAEWLPLHDNQQLYLLPISPMNTEIENYLSNLESRMWITRSSRFNASRRLNRKHYCSLASISILSVYGISIPIIQSIVDLSGCSETDQFYSAIATVLSVFILVISLLETSKNYQIRAEKMHESALAISKLCREIEFIKLNVSASEHELANKAKAVCDEYEQSVANCPYNHTVQDYKLCTAQYRKDFAVSAFSSLLIRSRITILDYWLYLLPIVIFPLLILRLYSFC